MGKNVKQEVQSDSNTWVEAVVGQVWSARRGKGGRVGVEGEYGGGRSRCRKALGTFACGVGKSPRTTKKGKKKRRVGRRESNQRKKRTSGGSITREPMPHRRVPPEELNGKFEQGTYKRCAENKRKISKDA